MDRVFVSGRAYGALCVYVAHFHLEGPMRVVHLVGVL